MTDTAGNYAARVLVAAQVTLSPNLSGYVLGADGPGISARILGDGPKAVTPPYQVTGSDSIGSSEDVFGGCLFGRVIVVPRIVAIGSLLGQRIWTTEVWSTFHDRQISLTGVAVTGAGGLRVTGPNAMIYSPGQSQLYTMTLDVAGDPVINNLATWSFTGILGADLLVTGSRVVLFPLRMDWSNPFAETISFMTSVLVAYSTSEQRIKLRGTPRYTLSFRLVSLTPPETAFLESLLYGGMDRLYGVPMWPEQSVLTAPVSIGDLILYVDTTNKPSFEAGGFVMLRRDTFDTEAFQIETVTASYITLVSATTKVWTEGARVVPLRRGRIFEDQGLDRPTNWLTAANFTFSCEDV